MQVFQKSVMLFIQSDLLCYTMKQIDQKCSSNDVPILEIYYIHKHSSSISLNIQSADNKVGIQRSK